jgi:ABC-type nickel/cobalt efflux system permease component RcnA
MLFALANSILLAGIVLVLAIAAGMTVTMAALGVIAILARRLVAGWLSGDSTGANTAARVGEYAGGALILMIGVLLFWSAY